MQSPPLSASSFPIRHIKTNESSARLPHLQVCCGKYVSAGNNRSFNFEESNGSGSAIRVRHGVEGCHGVIG